MTRDAAFRPRWASPPGDSIARLLASASMSTAELARRLGREMSYVDALLEGEEEVSVAVAECLAAVSGSSAQFWLSRERLYREQLASFLDETPKPEQLSWLESIPVREMERLGWIPKTGSASQRYLRCLRFYGVSSPTSWAKAYIDSKPAVVFKKTLTFDSDDNSVAAWLRQAELEASSMELGRWNPDSLVERMSELRHLTIKKDPQVFLPLLQEVCSAAGVAAVVVRAPEGCKASGAAKVLQNRSRLIALTMRHKSNDHLWFTLFHEIGHLVLHQDLRLFLDGENETTDALEEEANDFAFQQLIPVAHQAELLSMRNPSRTRVISFSRKIGIGPGLVVGQLQRLGNLRKSHLNGLKRRFEWNEAGEPIIREKL